MGPSLDSKSDTLPSPIMLLNWMEHGVQNAKAGSHHVERRAFREASWRRESLPRTLNDRQDLA